MLVSAHALAEGGAAATLARINEALIRRATHSRFATMTYAVLSADGRLTYSNAGHNPPMLFTRGGVRRLEQGGLVLGLFPHAKYEEETVQLDPGDVLVVFTDGVSERSNRQRSSNACPRRFASSPPGQSSACLFIPCRIYTDDTA